MPHDETHSIVAPPGEIHNFDALIIGAGFAGLYQLHCLRNRLGLSAQVLEAADGVGGTWYWNAIPARAAIPKAIATPTPSRRS